MDLEFINKFFRYSPLAVHLMVVLFFLWQIHPRTKKPLIPPLNKWPLVRGFAPRLNGAAKPQHRFLRVLRAGLHLIGPTEKDELPQKLLVGGVLFLLAFNIAYAASKTGVQYWAWKTGGLLSQAFLPPITPISYFLNYTGFRFWLPFLVNLLFAAIFFSLIYFSYKKQQRLFYKGEEYVAAISFLAVGWPGIIVYVPAVLFFMVSFSLFNMFFKKVATTSFLYFWLPLALFALLFGHQIVRMMGLGALFIVGF